MEKDGGPAFPWGEHGSHLGGMTLRDYFAAKALNGILACFKDYVGANNLEARAALAYRYADAMLKAREE